MRTEPKVHTDDLAKRLLRFFNPQAYTPSRQLREEPTFKNYNLRLVQARAQILREAGFLENKGIRSGLSYRLTEKGEKQREKLKRSNGHR